MMYCRKQQGRTVSRLVQPRAARRLVVATFAACLGSMTPNFAQAQSTTAMIHGQAPAGDMIVAKSTSGFRRHTTMKPDGKYMLRRLPLGVYSVTLKDGDKTVDRITASR